ncbi:hypothetical protein FJV48_11045 [Citrobacter freundii]|nr:hypothetical protein [Citrobacter freundii]
MCANQRSGSQFPTTLPYRTQAPLIDSLLSEIGLSSGSLSALAELLKSVESSAVAQEQNVKMPDGDAKASYPAYKRYVT